MPVVDVHCGNINEVWASMVLAMSNSAFIALDCELSGLGHRKKLNAKSIDDRYKNICEVAKSRSIISLGLSCYQLITSPEGHSQPCGYIVQTFNILLLCEEDYTVEPQSLKFLVQHGFDFNKQYEKGLPYYRGPDKDTDFSIKSPRHLFRELVSMKVPVILHNGLVDLMFLYENLYTSLPTSSGTFLADLADMFPGGLVDTKYITDYEHIMPASYLEYVFRKCQKDNTGADLKCVLHYPHYPATFPHVTYRDCSIRSTYNIADNPEAYKDCLCTTFAGHGWCEKDQFCPKSHNIDLIIDMDVFGETRKSRKRKRRKENREKITQVNTGDECNTSMDSENTSLNNYSIENCGNGVENSDEVMDDVIDDKGDNPDAALRRKVSAEEIMKKLTEEKSKGTHGNGVHRAGYDAFMTGFIFAIYKSRCDGDEGVVQMEGWTNKLYLCGKDFPLTVTKSSFSKNSKQHLEKMSKIRKPQVEYSCCQPLMT